METPTQPMQNPVAPNQASPIEPIYPTPPTKPVAKKSFFTLSRIILIMLLLAIIGFGTAYISVYRKLDAEVTGMTKTTK